jgi:hypothetical protein
MAYRVEWEGAGVVAHVTGTLLGEDMVGLVRDICEDPRFAALQFCIVDASAADTYQVDDQDSVASSATLIGSSFTNARVVVAVISRHAMSHAICGRLIEMNAMPFPPAVFPDLGMARRWIEAELPYRRSAGAVVEAWERSRRA